MRYYLIVGEASGDLHASHLMLALKQHDKEAQFRFIGGNLMQEQGGVCVRHYKELAYMGFVPVLMHLPTIMQNMKRCKKDIVAWNPDVVILVDYPGFNLSVAKYLKKNTSIPAFYYISPKIWAWKEWRIKSIKRDIAEMFSILPFETSFYKKHNYDIHYVGNPTAHEVAEFKKTYNENFEHFACRCLFGKRKPIIALLAGSRMQEIKDNLPTMLNVASNFSDYQIVIAGAPSIDINYYNKFIEGRKAVVVNNNTYALLTHASAALVTSGTATLETALFDVPQVVCYKTPIPKIIRFAFNTIIKVKFISLVNLIMDKEVVKELFADKFTFRNIKTELSKLLNNSSEKNEMLDNYGKLKQCLGSDIAPVNAAKIIVETLKQKK